MGISYSKIFKLIANEKAFLLNLVTLLIFLNLGKNWLSDLSPYFLFVIFFWLFGVILWGSFRVVHHAESLAQLLVEPYGTLVLTLSVTIIEVMMITSVMLVGKNNPVLARDTIYAIIMVILNGMLGLALLLGGWRYKEQQYNLQGSKAFLGIIFLFSIFGLILPNYTRSTPEATFSLGQELFLIIASISIYIIFLAIQTIRHQPYFLEPAKASHFLNEENFFLSNNKKQALHKTKLVTSPSNESALIYMHSIILILYLLPIIFLSKFIAIPIYYGLNRFNAPDALGGFIVAVLILAPEALSAVRASLSNELQRAVNILLGSVVASIVLTIPVVLFVSIVTGKTIILGLNSLNTLMLAATFFMSILTFGSGRTNVLQGALHLLLFFAYVVLIFD